MSSIRSRRFGWYFDDDVVERNDESSISGLSHEICSTYWSSGSSFVPELLRLLLFRAVRITDDGVVIVEGRSVPIPVHLHWRRKANADAPAENALELFTSQGNANAAVASRRHEAAGMLIAVVHVLYCFVVLLLLLLVRSSLSKLITRCSRSASRLGATSTCTGNSRSSDMPLSSPTGTER